MKWLSKGEKGIKTEKDRTEKTELQKELRDISVRIQKLALEAKLTQRNGW